MKRKIYALLLGLSLPFLAIAGLETGTYISDLVTTNPTGSDNYATADDHIRLLKTTIKNTFPNINNAVTLTDEQLNTASLAGHTHSAADVTSGTLVVARGGTGTTTSTGTGSTVLSASPALTGSPTVNAVNVCLQDSTNCPSVSVTSGSFTGTITGVASGGTGTVNYRVYGNTAVLYLTAQILATSNTTAMTMTGLAAAVQPSSLRRARTEVVDNSFIIQGVGQISGGTITFSVDRTDVVSNRVTADNSAFTASGNKGLSQGWQIVYPL